MSSNCMERHLNSFFIYFNELPIHSQETVPILEQVMSYASSITVHGE